jgi:hypothetical protein
VFELELRGRGGVLSLFWGLLISVYQISEPGARYRSGAKVPAQDQGSNPGGGKGVFVFSVQECSGDRSDLI